MKRLFKIGVLLLFMIGMFTVQAGFSTPVLVDDDVGMECTIDNLEDVILVEIITTPGQVASPLKYLTITSEMDNTGNRNQEIWYELSNDCNKHYAMYMVIQPAVIAEISSTNLAKTKLQESTTDIHASEYTFIITDLFRLDIGESFRQNCII